MSEKERSAAAGAARGGLRPDSSGSGSSRTPPSSRRPVRAELGASGGSPGTVHADDALGSAYSSRGQWQPSTPNKELDEEARRSAWRRERDEEMRRSEWRKRVEEEATEAVCSVDRTGKDNDSAWGTQCITRWQFKSQRL